MPRVLALSVKNYRALREATVQWAPDGLERSSLPIALIGPNGVGKSSFLDAIGFLSDALAEGVEFACDREYRGGFDRLIRQGAADCVVMLTFWDEASGATLVYGGQFRTVGNIPYVASEVLSHSAPPGSTFMVRTDTNVTLTRMSAAKKKPSTEQVTLTDPTRLAVGTLGQLADLPQVASLRDFLSGWYLCYFQPEAARGIPVAGPQRRLNRSGSNLGNYIQYLDRNHPNELRRAFESASRKIPGLQRIEHRRTEDGRLLLSFNERGYKDPFYQMSMSDGTLKLLAYLLLLADPEPPPLIGIEEPENGLYPRLQTILAEELREATEAGRTQVILSTHSPYLLNALSPESVFLMGKDDTGEVTLTRTSEIPTIQALTEEGVPLGTLWASNHFGEWTGE